MILTPMMRRRLTAYCAAFLLNLAIVSGSLTVTVVEHLPIVRLRRQFRGMSRFAPGEMLDNGAIVVLPLHVHRSAFHAN